MYAAPPALMSMQRSVIHAQAQTAECGLLLLACQLQGLFDYWDPVQSATISSEDVAMVEAEQGAAAGAPGQAASLALAFPGYEAAGTSCGSNAYGGFRPGYGSASCVRDGQASYAVPFGPQTTHAAAAEPKVTDGAVAWGAAPDLVSIHPVAPSWPVSGASSTPAGARAGTDYESNTTATHGPEGGGSSSSSITAYPDSQTLRYVCVCYTCKWCVRVCACVCTCRGQVKAGICAGAGRVF